MSTLRIGAFYSAPLPDSQVPPAELGAACCGLARGLASAQRQIEAFERAPATIGDLLASRLDAMRLMSRIDTHTIEVARAAHTLLVAALGKGGTIHDVSEAGQAGTRPLTLEDADLQLQHLEDRLAEIRRAFAPPAPAPRARAVA